MRASGPIDVREIQVVIDMGEQLYARYGYKRIILQRGAVKPR